MSEINAAALVALACHLGTVQAIEFVEFRESVKALPEQQRKVLLRGWLALESVPRDSSMERADLIRVLTALRQAWSNQ